MLVKISVIMALYNTEKFVWAAIESILSQTFHDFEFIIVDDGSTDESFAIAESFVQRDSRIRLLRNEGNRGIAYTRNRLITEASTNFIATQDSDDISFSDRLEKSYEVLVNNPNCSVVAGDTEIINELWEIIGYRKYSQNIRSIILKKSPIANPASMFRKDVFETIGRYRKDLNYGEDYDLWLRMYARGFDIINMWIPVIQLRIRAGQTKSEKIKETLRNTIEIQKRAMIEYRISWGLSDRIYVFLEQILYFMPSSLIMWLFKKMSYKGIY